MADIHINMLCYSVWQYTVIGNINYANFLRMHNVSVEVKWHYHISGKIWW